MAKKRRAKQLELSPRASRVMELVEIVGEGSQRTFAAKVGCSHTLISKIGTGQQEPGRTLIKGILALKNVEKDWFLTGTGQPPVPEADDHFQVPVADALLPGLLADYRAMLTSRHEPVPKALYGNGVYAVLAGRCEPTFSDPVEKLFHDDRIIIDSSPHRWRKNLQLLDGKLCAVVFGDHEREIVTLRRVRVSLDSETAKRRLLTVLDKSIESYRELQRRMQHEKETFGKYLKDIEIRPSAEIPAAKSFWGEIPTSSIAGVAIQLVRTL